MRTPAPDAPARDPGAREAPGSRGGQAVRDALVRAAGEMLGEAGPSALSVRDIARRAGVNHGQVHHYFGSKRALLREAMRELARAHYEQQVALAGGREVPEPLALAEDPAYWRAVCHVAMEGDLDLARVEIDEGISIPRRALRALARRGGFARGDLDFKARFATLAALNLGWVAFEDFVLMLAEVDAGDREEVRARVRTMLRSWMTREAPWTSP